MQEKKTRGRLVNCAASESTAFWDAAVVPGNFFKTWIKKTLGITFFRVTIWKRKIDEVCEETGQPGKMESVTLRNRMCKMQNEMEMEKGKTITNEREGERERSLSTWGKGTYCTRRGGRGGRRERKLKEQVRWVSGHMFERDICLHPYWLYRMMSFYNLV